MLLDKLDELGIADNTIVLYTSDNGPHKNSWPDAGVSPFRSEKETNWEGAFRVPALIRWPGEIEPGQISNEIVSGLDWLPTFVAAAGEPEIASKLLKGYRAGKQSFKVHLDGYNLLPYLTGYEEASPRESFFYFNDDTQLVGIRFHNWKLVFLEQRAQGTLQVWAEPFTELRLPKMFDLHADPFEQADITSNTYYDWQIRHAFLIVPAQPALPKTPAQSP
jgi:arylsulfatase